MGKRIELESVKIAGKLNLTPIQCLLVFAPYESVSSIRVEVGVTWRRRWLHDFNDGSVGKVERIILLLNAYLRPVNLPRKQQLNYPFLLATCRQDHHQISFRIQWLSYYRLISRFTPFHAINRWFTINRKFGSRILLEGLLFFWPTYCLGVKAYAGRRSWRFDSFRVHVLAIYGGLPVVVNVR